jgi:hypothetical protein
MKKIFLIMILSLGLAAVCCADTVYLKSGQKIVGRILTNDETGVQIETKLGPMKIKSAQIDRIEQVATEDYYLKEGDTLVQKGDLEKAISIYQTGYEKTQSPVLKERINSAKSALAQKQKEISEKQKVDLLAQHLAEYKRLKNIFADELAIRELEAAKDIAPNNQTVLELLAQEYFTVEERKGFTDTSSKFAELATRLFDLGSTDTTLRLDYSQYTTALRIKAEERIRIEQQALERDKAEQERRAQLEKEQEKTAPVFDYDAAFYPEAITWYGILDSPIYANGKIPILIVKGMRVYRADTTADVPQLIPIRGVMNIPMVGTQLRMRIKKLQSEKTTLGTLEMKGTMIPILLQLWDSQLLLSTKVNANMTDMKAKELLNDRTLQVTITWDTETAAPPQ